MSQNPPSIRFRRARTLARLARARLIHEADRSFLQPVLTLVTGTAFAHVIVLAGRPVLTRLFEPEAFGVLTVFVALAAVMTSVSAGRYEDALMLPRRRLAAANVFALGLSITAVSSVTALILIPFAPTIGGWFGGGEMVAAVVWLPAAVLFMGGSMVLESWHTRSHRFGLLSAGRTVQSATVVAVQIGAGLLAVGATGLVLGTVAGFVAAALILASSLLLRDRTLVRGLSLRWMVRLGMRYSRFPRFSAPASLLNNLAGRAPALVLAVLFASDVVGYFGVAFGTLALPVGLMTAAIGQVFFVQAAEALRVGTITDLTRRVLRQLFGVAVYPMLVVAAAGPLLFEFVFGEAWLTAGEYARWLAPWLLFASVAPPLTRIFDVLERQRADLTFSVVLFTVQTAVLVAAGLTTDALTTIIAMSVVGTILRIGHITYMLRLAGISAGAAIGDLLRSFGHAALPTAAVLATQLATGSGLLTLIAAAIGGLFYFALMRRGTRRI